MPHSTNRALAIAAVIMGIAGCGDKDAAKEETPKSTDPRTEEATAQTLSVTSGARAKLAWTQYQNPKSADTYANGDNHVLMGFDTADGLGARVILPARQNYSRPLITPDGGGIVFTRKNVDRKGGKKHFDPEIRSVGWDGTHEQVLRKGHAVDVWRDGDGRDWIVFIPTMLPSDLAQVFATQLLRVPLESPSAEPEILWDKGKISIDNTQLTRSGRYASGLFPWPDCGVFDFEKGEAMKYEGGCWQAMAPDDSGVSWIFDGSHRNLRMFKLGGETTWSFPVSRAPGVDGYETYHPRWSNHPRFFCLTGPYRGGKGGNPISVGGKRADIHIGRFSEKLDAVEAWARVTENKLGDFFPDLWIEGGETASLDPDKIGPASVTASPKTGGTDAPQPRLSQQNRDRLAFLWRDAKTDNKIGDRICHLNPRAFARYDRGYEALCQGGYFEVPEEELAIIAEAVGKSGSLAFEMAISPAGEGEIAALRLGDGKAITLSIIGGQIQTSIEGQSAAAAPMPDTPFHLLLNLDAKGGSLIMGGKRLADFLTPTPLLQPISKIAAIRFGDAQGGFAGNLSRIALYSRPLSGEEIAAHAEAAAAAFASKPKAPAALRVQAKLAAISPIPTPEEINPYQRCLGQFIYDIEEVIEGELDANRIIASHWIITDGKPINGYPSEIGKVYELPLEPMTTHPQLKGERVSGAETDEFDLPVFIDVSPLP